MDGNVRLVGIYLFTYSQHQSANAKIHLVSLNQAILYFSRFLYNAVNHPNGYRYLKTRFPL